MSDPAHPTHARSLPRHRPSPHHLEALAQDFFQLTQRKSAVQREQIAKNAVSSAHRLVLRDAHARQQALREQPHLRTALEKSYAIPLRLDDDDSLMARIERPPDGVQWVRATTNIRPTDDCCIKSYVPYLGESDEKQQTAEDVANEIDESSSSEEEDSDVEGLEPSDDPMSPSENAPKRQRGESANASSLADSNADGDNSRLHQGRGSARSRKLSRPRLTALKWDRMAKMATLEHVMQAAGCNTAEPIARMMSKLFSIKPALVHDYVRVIQSRREKQTNMLMDEHNENQNQMMVRLIRGEERVSTADALTKGDSIPYYFCRRCGIYDCSLHGLQRGHPKDALPDKTRKDTGPKHLAESIEASCKSHADRCCWHQMAQPSSPNTPQFEMVNLKTTTADSSGGIATPDEIGVAENGGQDTALNDDGCGMDAPEHEAKRKGRKPKSVRGRWKSRYAKTTIEEAPFSFLAPLADVKDAENWLSKAKECAASFVADLLAFLRELLPIFGPDFCRLNESLSHLLERPTVASSFDLSITCKLVGFICLRELQHLIFKPDYSQKKPQTKARHVPFEEYRVMNGGEHIRPDFVPCRHRGPCTKSNCPCLRAGVFCEKFCGCNRKPSVNRSSVVTQECPNLFKGCNCKSQNACMTKSCICFSWRRECDPDVCRSCHEVVNPITKKRENKCCNEGLRLGKLHRTLIGKSEVHGWGVFAVNNIAESEIVGEYVGELLEGNESERRGRIYDESHANYLFKLSHTFTLDSTRIGNKLRFVNHSNEPNCEPRMMRVEGDVRIGIYAKRNIQKHEELFFDYGPEFTQAFNRKDIKNAKPKNEKQIKDDSTQNSTMQKGKLAKGHLALPSDESDEESFDSGSTQEPRPVKAEGEKFMRNSPHVQSKMVSGAHEQESRADERTSTSVVRQELSVKTEEASKPQQQTTLTNTNYNTKQLDAGQRAKGPAPSDGQQPASSKAAASTFRGGSIRRRLSVHNSRRVQDGTPTSSSTIKQPASSGADVTQSTEQANAIRHHNGSASELVRSPATKTVEEGQDTEASKVNGAPARLLASEHSHVDAAFGASPQDRHQKTLPPSTNGEKQQTKYRNKQKRLDFGVNAASSPSSRHRHDGKTRLSSGRERVKEYSAKNEKEHKADLSRKDACQDRSLQHSSAASRDGQNSESVREQRRGSLRREERRSSVVSVDRDESSFGIGAHHSNSKAREPSEPRQSRSGDAHQPHLAGNDTKRDTAQRKSSRIKSDGDRKGEKGPENTWDGLPDRPVSRASQRNAAGSDWKRGDFDNEEKSVAGTRRTPKPTSRPTSVSARQSSQGAAADGNGEEVAQRSPTARREVSEKKDKNVGGTPVIVLNSSDEEKATSPVHGVWRGNAEETPAEHCQSLGNKDEAANGGIRTSARRRDELLDSSRKRSRAELIPNGNVELPVATPKRARSQQRDGSREEVARPDARGSPPSDVVDLTNLTKDGGEAASSKGRGFVHGFRRKHS